MIGHQVTSPVYPGAPCLLAAGMAGSLPKPRVRKTPLRWALPFISCGSLGEPLSIPLLQFPQLLGGGDSSPSSTALLQKGNAGLQDDL